MEFYMTSFIFYFKSLYANENIDRLNLPRKDITMPTDQYWIGDNESKGLAIFTFNGFPWIVLNLFQSQ